MLVNWLKFLSLTRKFEKCESFFFRNGRIKIVTFFNQLLDWNVYSSRKRKKFIHQTNYKESMPKRNNDHSISLWYCCKTRALKVLEIGRSVNQELIDFLRLSYHISVIEWRTHEWRRFRYMSLQILLVLD